MNKKIVIIPKRVNPQIAMMLILLFELTFIAGFLVLNILPTKWLILIVVGLLTVDLGISMLLASGKKNNKYTLGLVFVVIVLQITTLGSYYLYSTNHTINVVTTSSDKDTATGSKVTDNSYNIYISGVDFWGDISEVSRSDVNMIMTVNPKTKQILLTSIPRDSYIMLHSYQQPDKLTHTGIYGIDETTATVEDWFGIKIDYYVRANFNMAMAIVNAMGGIDVYSDYEFKSSISDYKYEKGWNFLTGKGALYFARERKSFKDSDQQRIKNQQLVVKAMIKKLTTSKALLLNYTKLLDAVEGYMETDLSKAEITSLVKMQLNSMDKGWTINTIDIKGEEEMKGTYSMGLGRPLTVNITDEASVERAVRLINKVENPPQNKPVKIKDDKSKKNNLEEQSQ